MGLAEDTVKSTSALDDSLMPVVGLTSEPGLQLVIEHFAPAFDKRPGSLKSHSRSLRVDADCCSSGGRTDHSTAF